MGPHVVERPEAVRDLETIADYIAERSRTAGVGFYEAARHAYELLARMPEAGSRWPTKRATLKGIRAWSIKGFRKYVIFYRPISQGIEVLRVVHGARDLDSLLEG